MAPGGVRGPSRRLARGCGPGGQVRGRAPRGRCAPRTRAPRFGGHRNVRFVEREQRGGRRRGPAERHEAGVGAGRRGTRGTHEGAWGRGNHRDPRERRRVHRASRRESRAQDRRVKGAGCQMRPPILCTAPIAETIDHQIPRTRVVSRPLPPRSRPAWPCRTGRACASPRSHSRSGWRSDSC